MKYGAALTKVIILLWKKQGTMIKIINSVTLISLYDGVVMVITDGTVL